MSKQESALELSFQMGTILLESGAEITRVQETMERIAVCGDTEKFNVYVLTNAIFANGIEKGKSHSTEIKFVKNAVIHLGKISELNQLSREVTSGEISVKDAFVRLEEIKKSPYARPPISFLFSGLGCACFSFLFGGTVFDMLSAFISGVLLELFLFGIGKFTSSKFLVNMLASFVGATSAFLLFLLGLGTNLDLIIIGIIIRLVPGVALTTSIRDFFNGDYLSGTIRMIDAVIVGSCIGIGVGAVTKLFSIILGGNLV
jgi:Uncharacterized conserved protein